MKRLRHALLLVVAAGSACVATPLPQPPIEYALDITKLRLAPSTNVVTIVGDAGALSPGNVDIRVTPLPDPQQAFVPTKGVVSVAADGSFTITLAALPTGTFAFEALEDDRDVYVDAIRGDEAPTADGVVVVAGDAGPDRDDDGSPDAIDCAPDDPDLSGSRCN